MTTTTPRKGGRPKGSRQLLPTQEERRRYIALLRQKADQGDPLAIAALLNITQPQEG